MLPLSLLFELQDLTFDNVPSRVSQITADNVDPECLSCRYYFRIHYRAGSTAMKFPKGAEPLKLLQ